MASTYTGQQKEGKAADIYPCVEWDSNLKFQCLSGGIHTVTQTARPLLNLEINKIQFELHIEADFILGRLESKSDILVVIYYFTFNLFKDALGISE
jgi:hypothetical protein